MIFYALVIVFITMSGQVGAPKQLHHYSSEEACAKAAQVEGPAMLNAFLEQNHLDPKLVMPFAMCAKIDAGGKDI